MTSEGNTARARRIFYDFEFIEDGRTIDPISAGFVDDDGNELYLINRYAPWGRIAEHPWLMANVVPSLPRASVTEDNPCGINFEHLLVVDRHVFAAEVRDFIVGDGTRPAELWAWFGAYDHVSLAQLFGPMAELPDGIPMWTNDIRQWQHQLGDPPLPDQPKGAHDALEDARFDVVRWTWLDGLASGRIGRDELVEVVTGRPRSATSPGDPDWVPGFGPVPGSGLAAL